MIKKSVSLFAVPLLLAGAAALFAQPPLPAGRGRRGGDVVASSVARMMAFDADQDGKLSKSEVNDPRLEPLFERADADKDGTVTKDELTALFTRESSSGRERAEGPNGGGFGPPPGGRLRPGEVLPQFLQDRLQLTRRQRTQLDALQADVDQRLARILTPEQLATLDEIRNRGPGDPPPGGPPPGGPPSGGAPPGDAGRGSPPERR